MKLERLHESLLPTLVIAAGLGLAVYSGLLISSGNMGRVAILLGAIFAVLIVLTVHRHIWIVIPLTWMLAGKVTLLPLPFTIAQLGVAFAFGTYLFLIAFKVVRFKPKRDLVDISLIFLLAYLVTVFIRNPVGVEALGSERVGGRPYVHIIIAFLGYWVLARSVASPKQGTFIPYLSIAGNAFHAIINEIAFLYPWTIVPLVMVYSGIAAAENLEGGVIEAAERKAHFAGVGGTLWLYACSRWRPVTLVNPLNAFRFFLFLLSAYAVLQSGFRSALFGMMLTFMISTYFRRGLVEALQGLFVGVFAVALLVAMQGRIINLPLPAQRALSFLPGEWEYSAIRDAQGSTEWRVEMWKAMLAGNKYIANKWFGDGFGFTRTQLQIMLANSSTGSTADQQENLLISGGVHSGPITAIRYVGYVGLAIFMIFLILVAYKGIRLIQSAKGTPYYTLALFLSIPSIAQPFGYVVIFGAFESDFPHAIIALGMLKLLENSIDAYKASQTSMLAPGSVQVLPGVRSPVHALSSSRSPL